LVREPDLNLLPPNLNPRIQELIQRCLQKNPKRRWQAIGDLRTELENIIADPGRIVIDDRLVTAPAMPLWKRAVPLFLAVILTALTTGAVVWWYFRPAASPIITRFPVNLPQGQLFTLNARRFVAISSDGAQIVYGANQRLYYRL